MAYNIEDILALPAKERRKISSRLVESLPENKLKLSKKETALLTKRWENHIAGTSKSYTSSKMWQMVFNK